MNKVTFAVVAVLAVAGCKNKAVDCEQALDYAMKISKDEMKAPAMDEPMAKIKTASLARCKEDRWSADALKCFANAKTGAELGTCEELKTPEQRAKLEAAVLEVMGPAPAPAPPDVGSGSAGSGAGEGSGSSGSATTDTTTGSAAAGSATP